MDGTLQRKTHNSFASLRVSIKAIPTASTKTRREVFLYLRFVSPVKRQMAFAESYDVTERGQARFLRSETKQEGHKEMKMMTAKKLAEMATAKLNERLIQEVFDIIISDKELYANYKALIQKSSAKNPAQAVNSAIGRAIGRIYGLKGRGVVQASLIKAHSKLIKG